VIAQHVARSAKLSCRESCLIRTQHSEQHRAGMDAKGRRDTVANAFTVQNPRLVSGERVLLVDDVFTTGATVSACADALLASGAESVLVITLARTLHY
jgi:predicted amidophosphoribosyltransferase